MRTNRKPTPFGRAVRVRLAELGLDQKDLAEKLGTSRAQITNVIYGDRKKNMGIWVDQICEALDMPVKAKWKKVA